MESAVNVEFTSDRGVVSAMGNSIVP
jgi:hypothetical protein